MAAVERLCALNRTVLLICKMTTRARWNGTQLSFPTRPRSRRGSETESLATDARNSGREYMPDGLVRAEAPNSTAADPLCATC